VLVVIDPVPGGMMACLPGRARRRGRGLGRRFRLRRG
jgi:hypothetical protein